MDVGIEDFEGADEVEVEVEVEVEGEGSTVEGEGSTVEDEIDVEFAVEVEVEAVVTGESKSLKTWSFDSRPGEERW